MPAQEPEAESTLVRQHLAGREEAFSVLYRRYFPRLVRLCRRWTRDDPAAEDLAQETLVRALEHLSGFDLTRPMWPWLKMIATRLAANQAARRARETLLGEHADGLSEDPMAGLEERPLLSTALARLNKRHRAAIRLRYIDGWTPSEAAAFLGLSAPAFRQLLARARARLRAEYRRVSGGALGLLGFPLRQLREVARRVSGRLQRGTHPAHAPAWTIPSETVHQVVSGVTALILVAGGVGGIPHKEAGRLDGSSAPVVAAPAPSKAGPRDRSADANPMGGLHPPASGPQGEAPAERPTHDSSGEAPDGQNGKPQPDQRPEAPAPTPSPGDFVPETVDDTADPNRDVDEPEDAQITSIAGPSGPQGSPSTPSSYSSSKDTSRGSSAQVLLAAGTRTCQQQACPYVLFRSDDGGASWSRLLAEGFRGEQLLVPPRFGAGDDRIFAMGPAGLQVSEDGGDSFRSAVKGAPSPVGPAAMSPGFNSGDPTILIGGPTMLARYRADTEQVEPVLLPGSSGPFHPAYSPDFPQDGLMFVSSMRLQPGGGGKSSAVSKCGEKGCSHASLVGQADVAQVRSGPTVEGRRAIYAFTPGALYLSLDDGMTYELVRGSWPEGNLRDVEHVSDGKTLLAALGSKGAGASGGLSISTDEGRSWKAISSAALSRGATSVKAFGDAIIVGLEKYGIACSTDGGTTWGARCSPIPEEGDLPD